MQSKHRQLIESRLVGGWLKFNYSATLGNVELGLDSPLHLCFKCIDYHLIRMEEAMKKVLGFIAVCALSVGLPAPMESTANAQAVKPGCKAYSRTITELQNDLLLRFSGGECGGTVRIQIRFSGGAQFKNEFEKDGSPKDPKKYARVSMELIRKTDSRNVCAQQASRDAGFNDFNLRCDLSDSLNPYDVESYTFRYQTNNVSNGNPAPPLRLDISYSYAPDA
jgi:hypothetical protein